MLSYPSVDLYIGLVYHLFILGRILFVSLFYMIYILLLYVGTFVANIEAPTEHVYDTIEFACYIRYSYPWSLHLFYANYILKT